MRRIDATALALLFVASVTVGCAPAGPILDSSIHPKTRAPLVAERLALPAQAVAVHITRQGEGLIALTDGRIMAVSVAGRVSPVDPVPGYAGRAGVFAFADASGEAPIALSETATLRIEHGVFHDDASAWKIRGARAYAARGASDEMWATGAGLFTTWGDGVVELQPLSGPLRDVEQIVPFVHDAWIRTGPRLLRVRLDRGLDGAAQVVWVDPAPGVQLGGVRAIARIDATRGAIASERGLTIVSPDSVRTFHGEPGEGVPDALGGGGGYAWVGWDGEILRTDGSGWEALLAGVALGPRSRIAVDEGTGASALVLDGAGRVIRVVAEDALRTSGITDGASVLDTRLELEVVVTSGAPPRRVEFLVDGKLLAARAAAPWGWGTDGARVLDVSTITFGSHRIEVRASYDGRAPFSRTIQLQYGSPLGRVPSYAKDIAPLYAARCARCHSGGVARDLSGYGRLSSQSTSVRAAMREERMPPDLRLDAVSAALFTSWIDGAAPP